MPSSEPVPGTTAITCAPQRGINKCVQVLAVTQPTVHIATGEGQETDAQRNGGVAWGTAVKMCFREEGTFDLGLGRSWIGTFGSGRALQELPGKRHGREKQQWFSLARTKELGLGRVTSPSFRLPRKTPPSILFSSEM